MLSVVARWSGNGSLKERQAGMRFKHSAEGRAQAAAGRQRTNLRASWQCLHGHHDLKCPKLDCPCPCHLEDQK